MKKILSLLLAFVLVLAVLPVGVSAVSSGSCGESVVWTFDEASGTLTLSGSGNTDRYDQGAVQPWASFRDQIVTVRVGPGITALAYDIFKDLTNLTTLELSEGLLEICSGAFEGCTALKEVILPDSLGYLGGGAFRSSGLEVAVLGGNLEYMGAAFAGCTNLQTVWFLGDAPEYCADEMFQGLVIYALYPDGNSTWDEYTLRQYGGSVVWLRYDPETFEPIPDTMYWSFDEVTGTVYIEGNGPMPGFLDGDQPWYDIREQILHVVIGEGITTVGNRAFERCFNLQTLTLPSTMMDIGKTAFASCLQLQNVDFPDGLRTIGLDAFQDCHGMTEVVLPDSVREIGYCAFFRCENLTKLTLPASLVTLGDAAFEECKKLETVIMPQVPDLTEVGERVFHLCYALTSMDFYTGTVIGKSMFGSCTGLTEIQVKDNVTDIGWGAFLGCTSATRAVFGTGLKNLGKNALNNCTALEQIVFTGNAPMIGENAFGKVNAEVRYPSNGANWTEEVLQNYGGTIKWVPYDTGSGIPEPEPDFSGKCGDNVTWGFVERSGKLTVSGTGGTWDYRDGGPDEWDSFRSRIRTIEVKPGVTDLGTSLFDYCTNAKAVILHEGLKTIDMFTFRGCKALTELVIPGSVTYIESAAFRDCTALVSIKLPSHFTRLPDVALRNTGFVTYTVPGHITALGAGSLAYCKNLEQVIFHEGITEIGNSAFSFTPKLGKLTWPSRVTTVQMSVFESSGLTELVLPATVNELQSYAFHNCASLEKLYVLGDIQTIGDYVFTNCSKLTIYGNSGTKIESYAKQNGIPFVVLNSVGNFLDVPADAFYAMPVKWALEEGITSGTSATEFSPYEPCLRSQVVTFLWRVAGKPKAESAVNPFVDVKPSDYYYDAVLWAVEKGITYGADETHFEPNGICNRSQVVSFLYRAFKKPPVNNANNPFADVADDAWYATPVLWAVEEGITYGLSDTAFGPNEVCDRSQVVTFLYRAYVN